MQFLAQWGRLAIDGMRTLFLPPPGGVQTNKFRLMRGNSVKGKQSGFQFSGIMAGHTVGMLPLSRAGMSARLGFFDPASAVRSSVAPWVQQINLMDRYTDRRQAMFKSGLPLKHVPSVGVHDSLNASITRQSDAGRVFSDAGWNRRETKNIVKSIRVLRDAGRPLPLISVPAVMMLSPIKPMLPRCLKPFSVLSSKRIDLGGEGRRGGSRPDLAVSFVPSHRVNFLQMKKEGVNGPLSDPGMTAWPVVSERVLPDSVSDGMISGAASGFGTSYGSCDLRAGGAMLDEIALPQYPNMSVGVH